MILVLIDIIGIIILLLTVMATFHTLKISVRSKKKCLTIPPQKNPKNRQTPFFWDSQAPFLGPSSIFFGIYRLFLGVTGIEWIQSYCGTFCTLQGQ